MIESPDAIIALDVDATEEPTVVPWMFRTTLERSERVVPESGKTRTERTVMGGRRIPATTG